MIISDSSAPVFDIAPSTQDINSVDDAEDSFLTLMLTQLQNQDPVDPIDNGEFLAQLASFETASGIRDLEDSFAVLADALTSSQTLQSASLVGRDVIAETNSAVLREGENVTGRVPLGESADEVTVEITDAGGAIVRQLSLGTQAGSAEFVWDGLNASGQQMPEGTYTITATGTNGDESFSLPLEIATRVDSVLLGGDLGSEVQLALANGDTVSVSQVKEIS
ncbi:MAG: flagellar hook assembly protein FlgD [Pseudomonadota bacterium]